MAEVDIVMDKQDAVAVLNIDTEALRIARDLNNRINTAVGGNCQVLAIVHCAIRDALNAGMKAAAAPRISAEALVDAAEELLEVAILRGDNDLPHPAIDQKPWTARMQTAWDALSAAVTDMRERAQQPEAQPAPEPPSPEIIRTPRPKRCNVCGKGFGDTDVLYPVFACREHREPAPEQPDTDPVQECCGLKLSRCGCKAQ